MGFNLDSFFKSYADSEDQLDFKFAHETVGKPADTISTGSLILDDALGCNGLCTGRIHQYYGRPGAGKSLMSMIAIKNAQKKDRKAKQVFIDAEQTFSPQWAEEIGVDTSRLIIIDGDLAVSGQRIFELLLGVPKADAKHQLVGKSKEGLLDKITNKDININLIVLDSIQAVQPPGEDTSAVGKQNMSLMARFLTPTFRKLSPELSKANCTMIIINHVRDNFNYGSDHTYSGGNSYSHFLTSNTYFTASGGKDNQILDENDERKGAVILATIEKTKHGPHPKKCNFRLEFGVGVIEREREIGELALKYGVVTKEGHTHSYKDFKWVGAPKFAIGIGEEPGLAEELIQKINESREALMELKRQEQLAKRLADGSSDEEEEVLAEEPLEEEGSDKPKKGKKSK